MLTDFESEIFVPLSCDLMFKKVFGDNENIERLEALLSLYLNIPIEVLHGNVTIVNNKKRLKQQDEKRQEVDLLANIELINGRERINIEVNKNYNKKLVIDRNVSYAAGIFSSSLNSSQDYSELVPLIQINFNVFDLYTDNQIVDVYKLRNNHKHILTEKFQIHHVNIEKCKRIWYDKSIDKYSNYEQKIIKLGALMSMNSMEEFNGCLEEMDMSDNVKKSIKATVEDFNSDEEMLIYYDKEQYELAMRNGEITLATERGIEQGIEKGAKEKSIEIAKNLLQKNIDIKIISDSTGLSIEEIQNLTK